jgi:hypothetical protein
MLEQVQPLSDLGGLGCPGARPIGLGASPIARDDLHPRVGPQPRRQGRGLPIGPQGDRLPAFPIDPYGPRGLACSQGELVDAQGPWRAVARERQATDATAEGLTAERASQAPTQTHAGRPAQREPEGDQPRDQAPRPPSPGGDDLGKPLRQDPPGAPFQPVQIPPARMPERAVCSPQRHACRLVAARTRLGPYNPRSPNPDRRSWGTSGI